MLKRHRFDSPQLLTHKSNVIQNPIRGFAENFCLLISNDFSHNNKNSSHIFR